MKKLQLFIIMLLCAAAMQAQSILSLNNSLIQYNNQPEIFNNIARSMGKDASWQSRTMLGKTLLNHYNDQISYACATKGDYDVIVLQEQSSMPRVTNDILMQSVILWERTIIGADRQPQFVVPMNWAFSEWNSYAMETQKLLKSYAELERDMPGTQVTPIGLAYWLIFQAEGQEGAARLYTDHVHPTLKASYLAACMEYAVICDEDPEKISYVPDGLSQEDAASMRRYASQALRQWADIAASGYKVPKQL